MIDVKSALGDLIDGVKITSVNGDMIPSVPGAKYPGEHLLINCRYSPDIVRLPPAQSLFSMRKDMIAVLRRVANEPWLSQPRSVCVTFYDVVAGEENDRFPRAGRRRAYRYSILREGLHVPPAAIDEDYLLSNSYSQESSEIEAIQLLIQMNPCYNPTMWK